MDFWRNFKWPTKHQWRQFGKIISKKEKYSLWFLSGLIIFSGILLTRNFYFTHTTSAPDFGDVYQEGIVGFPRYLNPILAQTNEADRDVTAVIFSGLLKPDPNGGLMTDLAETYSVSEDGKTYEFFLKRELKWHNNKDLNADDVIFTINRIQNPDFRSPLRLNWQGVEIEKIDNWGIRFKLKNPYAPFLDNLTVGILPKHIWEKISAPNFPLTEYNFKPIGAGPYKFKKLQKDASGTIKTLELEAFSEYSPQKPFIKTLIFRFFKDEDSVLTAYNSQNKEINGLGFVSAKNITKLKNNINLNKIILPRYFAVFFNQTQSKVLADKSVRQALNYATDKQEIIAKALFNEAVAIDSAVPPFSENNSQNIFNLEQTKTILESAGWTTGTTSPVRQKTINKEITPLEFSLLTLNQPEIIEAAEILKNQWGQIGAKVNIEINEVAEIQEKIRSRQYQALLFGQVLSNTPDLYSFWHSSQTKDPGLNLALYNNSDADKRLTEITQNLDPVSRKEKYEQFKKLLADDAPAIFLYSPLYLYPVSKQIKGTELNQISLPSARFSQIANWYIKTKRVWK